MNKNEFINILRVVVHDSTVNGIKTVLIHPPGRCPHPKEKASSEWYNSLEVEDQAAVQEIIRQSVHATLFNTLCVLDGVIAIESSEDKGALELTFRKNGKSTLLNDIEEEDLHDIYQALVQNEVFGDQN